MDRVMDFSFNSRDIHQTKHHLNRSHNYGGSDQVIYIRFRDNHATSLGSACSDTIRVIPKPVREPMRLPPHTGGLWGGTPLRGHCVESYPTLRAKCGVLVPTTLGQGPCIWA